MLPSTPDFICGTVVGNALSRCLAPWTLTALQPSRLPPLYPHSIHTLLSVSSCPWCLPLCGKMGVGGRGSVL